MAATKVLVVDDDLNIQRVLVFTLKQEGYEVHVASDGQAGVEMAASIEPDLILMDVAMPVLDGYAATQRIRASETGAKVPIIMLTAEAGVGQQKKAAEKATMGRLACFYPAKGGVGTTTIAINTAIALASRLKRKTALFDANLQFGDMRVFLDLGLDSSSIVNAITEPDLDADLLKTLMVP